MSDTFEVTYGNDDGYAGGDRPHHVEIEADELSDDMTEEDMKQLFWREIEEDFQNRNLHLYSDQESEFIEWAKERIAEMKTERPSDAQQIAEVGE